MTPNRSSSLVAGSGSPHGTALLSSPDRMTALWDAAKALAGTTAVPAHFRGKPGEVFGAMLLLDGLGAHPVTALRLAYEIKGNLGVQSKLKIATANARGAFKGGITFKVEGKAGGLVEGALERAMSKANAVIPGDLRVTAQATTHDGEVVSQTVALSDAVAMGWTQRGLKGGPNARWEVPAMQVRMLSWRAADWLIEQYAPEVTSGVRSVEELHDMDAAGELQAPRDVTPEEGDELDELNREAAGEAPREAEAEPPEGSEHFAGLND